MGFEKFSVYLYEDFIKGWDSVWYNFFKLY